MIVTSTAQATETCAALNKQEPVQVLYFNADLSERLVLPFGQHDIFVVKWLKQGSGTFTVDFTTQDIQPGRMFFVAPNAIHHLDTQQETTLEGWTLLIHLDYLADYGSNLVDLLYSQLQVQSLDIPLESQRKLDQIFNLLHTELQSQEAWKDTAVNAYLAILLTEFKRLSAATTPELKHLDSRYEEFLQLMHQDFKEVKDVESYAERVNLSTKQLNRICKEASGKTARQLIDYRIMLEARRLLHHTSLSVKEIAYELGFEEPSSFIKFFHRFSEHTPLQYRNLSAVDYHAHYSSVVS
ncbi:AraC family transcriptional regulator [Pontibacter silvestris]|uniref:AraC family transcriptional regulator n=1 Tax=Pontibacter silvestris TaxID=2305183 RepID=A0ABW4WT66_9BACT|nr:helix-turn-helix domain-containing protein [Pontibacter silvestris]MCC9136148.1 AraC family transcriptional regulator [Pontibacter silvestris]